MATRVVVDASVALKWLLEEELAAEAVDLLAHWRSVGVAVLAPALLPFEVANVLHRRVVRGGLTSEDARRLFEALGSLGLDLVLDFRLQRRAIELAGDLGQPAAYDAQYLALAEREACEFWTADQRLWRSAGTRLPAVHWLGERKRDS